MCSNDQLIEFIDSVPVEWKQKDKGVKENLQTTELNCPWGLYRQLPYSLHYAISSTSYLSLSYSPRLALILGPSCFLWIIFIIS